MGQGKEIISQERTKAMMGLKEEGYEIIVPDQKSRERSAPSAELSPECSPLNPWAVL